jgi:hypothetical protein
MILKLNPPELALLLWIVFLLLALTTPGLSAGQRPTLIHEVWSWLIIAFFWMGTSVSLPCVVVWTWGRLKRRNKHGA